MGNHQKAKKSDASTGFTVFLKVSAFITPLALYILFTTIIFPAPNSGFLSVGIVGSLVLGVGLISLTGLIDEMYLGNTITGATIGSGSLLIIISSLIMYIPSIYSMFNEQYISFYFLIWTALIISAIWYVFFRMGVSRFLRNNKISKTSIEKAMKGAKNYWWYEAVNKEHSLGWMYYLNKGFTCFYLGTVLIHLLLGWIRIISPLILLFTCVICILTIVLWLPNFLTQENENTQKNHKKEANGIVATLGFLFPLLICVALILYFIKIQ